MLQGTTGQLVCGGDRILIPTFITDWEDIRRRKQDLIDQNNENKNGNLQTTQLYST